MKNIYKQFNNIEFDIDKINSMDINIDELTKNKIKNNLKAYTKKDKRKKIYKNILISVASFLLVFTLACQNEFFVAFARNIPILGSVFETFESSDKKAEFNSYSQKIGESQESKGYEVTIDEVVLDDHVFMITYTIKSKEKFLKKDINRLTFLINETPNKTRINNRDITGGGYSDINIIDDYTIQILDSRDIYNMKLKDNATLDINITQIQNTKGSWKFQIPLNKSKTSNNTKSFNPNTQIKVLNKKQTYVDLVIKYVHFSPISTNIYLKSKEEIEPLIINFKDDKGNILNPLESGAGLNTETLEYEMSYRLETMKDIPDKIFIEYRHKDNDKISKTEIKLK